VLWAPRETFTVIGAPSGAAALGDRLEISADHTFPTDEGFISWLCKKDTVTIMGASSGDSGAKNIIWEFKFTLLGDDSTTQQQVEDMLNDDIILLFKDADCINATAYSQLGDACVNPEIDVKFDGKTTKEGLKEYEITGKIKGKKYWYSGDVTEKA
jgi:hypothetical protein